MPSGNKGKRISKAQQFGKTKTNQMFRVPERFASINKLITRDLNGRTTSPSFSLYNKDDINTYLQDPYKYQKQLRAAAVYIYGASSHFRRLVQYFVSLTDLSYVVAPYNIDPATAKVDSLNKNYRKVLHAMSAFNVKSQCATIITTCMREDTYYGTMWETPDNVILQNLPAEFCDIATVEDGVFNVTFNFSYFDSRLESLEFYPPEFQTKYNLYLNDRTGSKFQELEAPTSFAIKCNNDILDYPIPPFAGVLREIYDIEDYKQLKLTKTTLENYAMVVMTLGMDKDGEWQMELNKAKEFWGNLDSVLPEEIGSVLSPMPVEKISFEKANTGNTDTIVEAEQNMFTCAGVSSLLFNNANASSGALSLSIKADQAITYGIVKSIEDMFNRYLHRQSYGKNFKVTFLDCSPFNRKEIGDMYLGACQYGVPMASFYCASQGLSQEDMECMSFLEHDMLNLREKFTPLQSANTQSASSETTEVEDEGGAPEKDLSELSDSGEQSREDGDDW